MKCGFLSFAKKRLNTSPYLPIGMISKILPALGEKVLISLSGSKNPKLAVLSVAIG
ncbi:hypothetical protein [Porphyromonas cangingivalis]|uniref:hypothetical protein n=1 Tax=Porphyromonas cangingivalis TaxID=36874 RepID=UPI000AFAC2A7|nr:hypothetical protein [Porphyromonas cangingivalis]